jgi:site-specific DNA recombinase
MLTIAYCRVSTEEQAEEGFSIEGQSDRLRQYAQLRDLGHVTVICDPGQSGKDLARPGLQEVLRAVNAGHAAHVLVWRLDRLSRNLADLLSLAELFGDHDVALHSVSEQLDLSSAAGRMFYNVLGTFAQYFREQLAENVRLGNDRARREGRYLNRPKLGYDLRDGLLVPNADAETVRRIFELRASGLGYRQIEEITRTRYSTVVSVLSSRVYLGEVPHRGEWLQGRHEPIVDAALFDAVASRHVERGPRATDPMAGRVRCGVCGKRMAIAQNGQGGRAYKCRHRGRGCSIPARSNRGLARAALLALELLGHDEVLRATIRRRLGGDARAAVTAHGRRRTAAQKALGDLSSKRRKLLELHYAGRISQEGFFEEEQRLQQLYDAEREAEALAASEVQGPRLEDVERRCDELSALDVRAHWIASTDAQRRALVASNVDSVTVFEDRLRVEGPRRSGHQCAVPRSGHAGVGDCLCRRAD